MASIPKQQTTTPDLDHKLKDPLDGVPHRVHVPDIKTKDQGFVLRVGEEYVCTADGEKVTPYLRHAFLFRDFVEVCDLAQVLGAQVWLRYLHHPSSKRLLLDFSVLA